MVLAGAFGRSPFVIKNKNVVSNRNARMDHVFPVGSDRVAGSMD